MFVGGSLAFGGTGLASQGGGAGLPDPPAVNKVECITTKKVSCPMDGGLVRGGKLRATGTGLSDIETIQFRGTGAAARVEIKPVRTANRRIEARVPARAQSGPIVVVSDEGAKARKRVKVSEPTTIAPPSAKGSVYYFGDQRKPTFAADSSGATELQVIRDSDGATIESWTLNGPKTIGWNGYAGGEAQPSGKYRFRSVKAGATVSETAFWLYDHIFPIRGKHNLGYTGTNNFGGARSHKGQDMFAECGTPLVATRAGKVKYAGNQGDAGNYVVVDEAGSDYDYVYMHMRRAPLVKTGDRIYSGQPIGEVGETGNAQGCHLHFEYWTAPGWWSGGKAINSLPYLRAWDAVS